MYNQEEGFYISDLLPGSVFRETTGQHSFNKPVLRVSQVPGTLLKRWGVPTQRKSPSLDELTVTGC